MCKDIRNQVEAQVDTKRDIKELDLKIETSLILFAVFVLVISCSEVRRAQQCSAKAHKMRLSF